jgi:GDPmannose 4,6-dehydratase
MQKKNNAIIFGAGGQDGYFLLQLLAQQQVNVLGISRSGNFIRGDVGDYSFVEAQIKQQQPAFIFHFAANSTTRHDALFENHKAISTGTLNILESVKLHSPHSRVFLSGSAMQFKNTGDPINESSPFEASSPYSVARIQSVYAARYYRDCFGLKVYVGYFFNHDSFLRSEKHVNKKITAAVNKIKNGSTDRLSLGNIEVKKEFNFAGDMMEAVWILVNQDKIFEAVIGSGEAHSIKEWVVCCFGKYGLDWEKYIDIKKDFLPEYEILVSDPTLIKSLGWTPGTSFEQLAEGMLVEG